MSSLSPSSTPSRKRAIVVSAAVVVLLASVLAIAWMMHDPTPSREPPSELLARVQLVRDAVKGEPLFADITVVAGEDMQTVVVRGDVKTREALADLKLRVGKAGVGEQIRYEVGVAKP